jgi:hypothetical protein
MEQFNLDKWLKDKSRKVVTREGKPVRIICWDLKCNTPIIAAIQWNQEREDCYCYNTVGWCANNEGELDLFFADEEEELTEFEKRIYNLINFSDTDNCPSVEEVKEEAEILLDLARKEFLKDLPKWKKDSNNLSSLIYTLDNRGDGRIFLCRKGYAININELLNLPKEE